MGAKAVLVVQKDQGRRDLFVDEPAPHQVEAGQQADGTDEDQGIGFEAVQPFQKQGALKAHLGHPA